MNKIFLCLAALTLWSLPALSQSDTLKTKKSQIVFHPVLHSSMVIEWNGKTIYIDPYGGAEKYAKFKAPDLIVITDIHGDHMNRETLEGLDLSKADFVVPEAVYEQIKDLIKFPGYVMGNFQEKKWKDIIIYGIPMYNLPESDASRHPKGRGNGYVLSIEKKNIYISGDTEDIPEMRGLRNIDVAFVCMNQPFTMTVDQAADAVLEFKPKVVYPFHYRGAEGKLSDVNSFKEKVEKENPKIEVRLRDWYPSL